MNIISVEWDDDDYAYIVREGGQFIYVSEKFRDAINFALARANYLGNAPVRVWSMRP